MSCLANNSLFPLSLTTLTSHSWGSDWFVTVALEPVCQNNKLRLDALSIPHYVIKKGTVMVLDTAKPKNRKSTKKLGMRGRDAVRKSTFNVNILQVFTIDFPEIQFIVNHNSQSDGQNKRAKSGMNLHKKTIPIISLQRKRKDTKDNGILL